MRFRNGRLRRRGLLALLGGGAIVLAAGAAMVLADGGSLDLQVSDRTGYEAGFTTDGAKVEYIGDQNVTFGSAGTGTFGTFVQVQNTPTESGYNTNGTSQFDTGSSPQFNHAMLLSDIPVVDLGGQPAWELFADINDSNGAGGGSQISLNDLEIYFTSNPNLTGYPFTGTADKAYDFSGSILINDVNQGSGRGDLRYSIPLSKITTPIPPECTYKNPACTTYFVLYSRWGTTGGNFISDSGFEEWKVKTYPYVTVTKTANTSLTRTYNWTINKSVAPATWNLFTNETGTSQYTVSVDKTGYTDSNWAVSGTIHIANPGTTAATISSVSDVISGVGSVTASCGVSFPYTLAKNASLDCTYSSPLPDGTDRTNTATVLLTTPGIFQGTTSVSFASPTITPVNASINVTDTNGSSWGPVSDDATWNYDKTFTCDGGAGTHDNTATITETGQHDDASVTVSCYEINVTKDASTSLTRTYNWTIDKSVTPATWALFTGESGTSRYTVSVDKTGTTDSGWGVTGNIHVNNPNPIAATINSVTDAMTGGINATVVCGVAFPYTLAPNSTLDCTYSAALPDGTARTNTATAVRQNHSYTSALVASNSGTTTKTGTASVSFASPTITSVNATINVTDSVEGALGSASDDNTFTYDKTFTCDGDAGKHDNTATITETGQHDDASVTVSCYEINVTKDAATTYQRQFHWTIDKFSTDPNGGALTLNPGETYVNYPYSVKVDLAATPYTDSAWAVSGNIHVNNPNPIAATINSVTDVLATDGTATVDCGAVTFPYTLLANSTLDCTYTKALPSADNQLNTATAVRQNHNYTYLLVASDGTTASKSGTANVTFGAPTTLVDESITIVDDYGTPANTADDLTFGPVSYTQAPKTFTYTRTFGPFATDACGQVTIDNTVTFTTNDTSTTGTDHWPLVITIPCPTGCTLTQGYWKTHSEFGPAPEDPNWYNLSGGLGPNTPFFSSGQTWYQVFWTNPKGGNAYYILAHQYEAAVLNTLTPADAPQSVLDAMSWAETFFTGRDPNATIPKTLRQQAISYAGILGSYNTGAIGPGHCSEDSVALAAPS